MIKSQIFYYIFIFIIAVSCKKTATSTYPIGLENGTYEWVTSIITNDSDESKLISSDSINKNFFFKIENKQQLSFYENDKLVYSDKIKSVENLGSTTIMTHLTFGYAFDSYKITFKRSQLIISLNLYYGEYVVNNFPFIQHYSSDKQIGFNNPIIYGSNLFKKI